MSKLIKNIKSVSPVLTKEFLEPKNNANDIRLEKESSIQSKTEIIKNLLKNDLRTELFEVYSKIFHTPHLVLKLYLFIFVAGSTCLASYMVIQTILAYFEYNVITTSRTIFETPTLFPKITFCNTNMFQTEYALKILQDVDKQISAKAPFVSVFNKSQMYELDKQTTNELIKNLLLLSFGTVGSNYFTDDERKLIGHGLDDILLDCKYDYQTCTPSDFTSIFDSTYGNCFVFNSGYNSTGHKVNLKQSSISGSIFGLQLKLYVNYNENLTLINSFHGGTGVLLRIDNSSYLTDHSIDGIRISAGTQNDIVIDRTFKFTLPKPYSNCEIDYNSPKTSKSELYNLIANSSYEYKQGLCLQQCFQKLAIKDCNCSAGILKSFFNVDSFKTFEEFKCFFNSFDNVYIKNDYIQNECVPLCPLECNLTQYKTVIRSNNLPGDIFVNYVQKNRNLSSDFVTKPINSETVSQSIVSLNIFYESLSYTLSTESPQMDVISLLANIGGHLGLFLGISVFSLCEIVEVAMEMILIKLKKS